MIDYTKPHRRQNPLTGDWILVSPQRTKRPWQGVIEPPPPSALPAHDPNCYLCPGNTRASGEKNPIYDSTYVFTNDHPSLLPDVTPSEIETDTLLTVQQERGTSKVVCYTPNHNRTMANMTSFEIGRVIDTWIQEYKTIGALPYISYVQIFENKGPMMGASSPHPHSQIWANEHLPTIVEKELTHQRAYLSRHKQTLLAAYLKQELKEKTRLVYQNEAFVILVPFWATWPYETMIMPTRPIQSLTDLTPSEKTHFALALNHITQTYDGLFQTPFPYSMGIHQAPTDKKPHDEWQLHIHFYPPLLRSATVKKHYVGYEMMAEAQRDLNPEDAAATLRSIHA